MRRAEMTRAVRELGYRRTIREHLDKYEFPVTKMKVGWAKHTSLFMI
jgi:hypothetical protein